jgi:hypothetical protein
MGRQLAARKWNPLQFFRHFQARKPGGSKPIGKTFLPNLEQLETRLAPVASTFAVSGYPSPTTAGVAHTFTVTAKDSLGSTATDYSGTVHFSSSDSQAVLPANSTLINGIGTFSATFKTAVTQSLTATDTVTASITGTQAGIVVNPAAASTLSVSGYSSPTIAGAGHTVTVTAKDSFGNTATGYTGTVHFSSSDAQAVLPANSTLSNGTGSFSATLKTAGTQSLTATDTVTASITGIQAGIVVNPAAASTLTVSGYASPTTAGVAHAVTVTAKDAFGNTATAYNGTVHFSSSDGQAVLPANSTLSNGTGSFSAMLKTAGSQSLTATDTVTASITGIQAGIVVNPATASTFTGILYASPTTAGAAHNFTLTAQDAFGNTATGYSGTVHFSSSDAQAVLPANSTLTSGTRTFSATFKTAGLQSLTGTDTVTASLTATQSNIVVNPAPANTFTVSGYASPTTAGVPQTFTVTAKDAFGNTATGYAGTVHFTSSDAQAVLPANSTLTNGTGSFSATLKTAGPQSLTATDTVTGSLTGTQAGIVVGANFIVTENLLAGSPASVWDTDHADDPTIRGFADGFSVNLGQSITFKIDTPSASGVESGPVAYHLQIFRLGYYQGNGARLVARINGLTNQVQPAAQIDHTTGLVDCGTWHVSYTWAVPAGATSGIYFAKATRDDGQLGTDGLPASNQLFFIVRDDGGHSDILAKTCDATWQAYNYYGGAGLYDVIRTVFPVPELPYDRAYKVSYNRPFLTARPTLPVTTDNLVASSWNWVFYTEYPMVRWLEANGYNVSYTTDLDAQRNPASIRDHKVFVAMGHDEYWSEAARNGVEAARAAGVNLAFLDGNEIYEKIAWEPGIGGSAANPRTLACYKDSFNDPPIPHAGGWTGLWDDQGQHGYPPRPVNALTGQQYVVSDTPPVDLLVPATVAQERFWRNTDIANLRPGDPPAVIRGVIGFEWDEPSDNGFQPAGLIAVSGTAFNGPSSGARHPGTVTHSLVLARDNSGALVFSAGTVLWSWALDNNHDPYSDGPEWWRPTRDPPSWEINYVAPVDQRVRQAMVNLFADMGNVQPGSLQPGVVPATASTDTVPPRSTITTPTSGTTVRVGTPVTIAGTAVDSGGGVVAGVEVSVNGGLTWHPASGRGTWSYTWSPTTVGPATIRSRAVDDSGNLETPAAGVAVTVAPGPPADHFLLTTSAANPDVAGTPLDVTVTAKDANGNTVGGYSGTIHFTCQDLWSLPDDYTFTTGDAGVHSFPAGVILYTSGASGFTVTDTSSGISGTANVTVIAAPVAFFEVDALLNATSGMALDVTVIANDAYGNATNYTGTVHFTTSDRDPRVILPPDYTFQAGDAGMVVFAGAVILFTPGGQTLIVTDAVSGITGSVTITIG